MVYIYQKQKQTQSVKKSFAALKTRVETRVYPKDIKTDTENPEIAPNLNLQENIVLEKNSKQKLFQKFPENLGSGYSIDYYKSIMKDYNSPLSQYLRNLMYLNTLLNGFSLSPNTKEKNALTPWFLDTFVMPIWILVQNTLLEHPEFLIRALPSDYKGEVLRMHDRVYAIRTPKISNGGPTMSEVNIDKLISDVKEGAVFNAELDYAKGTPQITYKSTLSENDVSVKKRKPKRVVAVVPSLLSVIELESLK